MEKGNTQIDIDIVYMWVDGSDPAWKKKKDSFLASEEAAASANNPATANHTGCSDNEESVSGKCRFCNNDELKYSLRSLEMFAPWIRNIFIVTDNQIPVWLNTENPKIKIIDHKEIMPAEILPVFNSALIELYLSRIPGLSEHFLLANDDTMFAAPASESFFFTPDGKPIIRLHPQKVRVKKDYYSRLISNSQDAIERDFHKRYRLAPHHNIDAYRKSDYDRCLGIYSKWTKESGIYRFRNENCMYRSTISYYALATGNAVLRKVGRYNNCTGIFDALFCFAMNSFKSDSRCIPLRSRDYMKIMDKYNPVLFAMNDGEGTTDEDRARAKEFLELYFPEKSTFER